MNDKPKDVAWDKKDAAWFTTSVGLQFFPWRPDPSKISLTDIAHTLSQINRWGGHTRFPYSVAQHSCLVAARLAPAKQAWGLMHDSTEAYMGGDIVSPIKRNIPDLVALEAGIARAICTRFGLPEGCLEDPDVKHADLSVLAWEYRDLMPSTYAPGRGFHTPQPMSDWGDFVPDEVLVPWPPEKAKVEFLFMASLLGLTEQFV